MMRDGAADWLATLSTTQLRNYDSVIEAFRDNYFVPVELRWKITGLLWNQSQREDETVEDFVTRIRRGARRINLADTQLVGIILNGLRPSIRMHVLQKGGDTLNDLIKTAKLAEAVAPPSSDTTNALLLKYIQASSQANEKQSKEIQKLTSKIIALADQNEQNGVNVLDSNQVSENRPQQRFHRPTPQNQQRDNYARNFNTRTPQGGATGFLPRLRVNVNPSDPECDQCGLRHATTARCFAQGLQCRSCQKFGHFARKCKSVRRPLFQQQPPPAQSQQQ